MNELLKNSKHNNNDKPPEEESTLESRSPESNRLYKVQRVSKYIFAIMLVVWVFFVWLLPMGTFVRTIMVTTLLSGIFTVFIYILRYAARKPGAAYPFIFFFALFLLWATVGGKHPVVDELRTRYVDRLENFLGDPYMSGGETHRGIDGSGLARAALWQAMIIEGLHELNPYLIGPTFWSFWWNDISVSDIRHSRHGYTKVIGEAERLAGYDYLLIEPGDMAITKDDNHILIHTGQGYWIEASKNTGKVVENRAVTASMRPNFNKPVYLVRWWILEPQEKTDN